MNIVPLEIKLFCTFGTLSADSSSIEKKNSFNVEISKLEKDLFLQCFDELCKIKEKLSQGENPYANVSEQ